MTSGLTAEGPRARTGRWSSGWGWRAIALAIAALFAFVALAAFDGGELFLGVMAGIGGADDPVGRRSDRLPPLSRVATAADARRLG